MVVIIPVVAVEHFWVPGAVLGAEGTMLKQSDGSAILALGV